MKRILSIDWDYFVDATADERYEYFPDGGDETIPYPVQDFIWQRRYSVHPTIQDMGVIQYDYKIIRDILFKFSQNYRKQGKFNVDALATVSHSFCYNFIKDMTQKDEEFEVYNIDFHHDMYHYVSPNGDRVNCGNWVNMLLEERPNAKYHWVKREDSEDTIIGGDKVSCDILTLPELLKLDFDAVFLCRSDCWSPPHLDKKFKDLISIFCFNEATIKVESRVMTERNMHATGV